MTMTVVGENQNTVKHCQLPDTDTTVYTDYKSIKKSF